MDGRHLLKLCWNPTWIRPALFPALSYLDIRVKHEQRDDIQVLGTLPCLGHPSFTTRREAVERSAVGADAFPRLATCVFDISDACGGTICTFPQGAMPMLQHYEFWIGRKQLGCVAVEDRGLGLGHLPSLQSVTALYYFGVEPDETVREKLEQEAAVHPNHPLRVRVLRRVRIYILYMPSLLVQFPCQSVILRSTYIVYTYSDHTFFMVTLITILNYLLYYAYVRRLLSKRPIPSRRSIHKLLHVEFADHLYQ